MKKLNILVTGGNGFIGSHLVEKLERLGYRVTVVDLVGKGYRLDIGSPRLVDLLVKLKPQVVYHLAADNRVTGSVKSIINSNIIGTYNVLTACRQAQVKQLIFTSSAAIYGNSQKLPIRETWPKRPLSAYGLSKLTDELYLGLFNNFHSTVFRFANVYGPRQSDADNGGVVSIFIKRILAGRPVTVYGDGRQIRDFIYVADVVEALVAAIGKNPPTAMNIGSNQPTSILDLIKLIERLTGKTVKIYYRPKRPVEISRSLFSYQRAKKYLGWQPKTTLEAGINATINYYLAGVKRS